jgi:molecular chaperone Hsp33
MSDDRALWDDSILPFQLDAADIRGRVVRLDQTMDKILTQHDYPPQVSALVADATLLTALIGQTIDLRWKLSLQIRGDGPIHLIATDYFGPKAEGEPAEIRAYAGYREKELTDGMPFSQLGKGVFGILIDQGPDMAPYQGITPIAGSALADCASTYFAQSEQLPTSFALASAISHEEASAPHWRGGGIMIQHMPKQSPFASEATGEGGLMAAEDFVAGEDRENWTRVQLLLDTVEMTELIGPHVDPDRLLLRLFHEESPRVWQAQAVQFGCTCSAEKLEANLAVYSADEINDMMDDDGKLVATCQFCGARYNFDPERLKLLG